MSFVVVAPELVESAAHDLAGIGSTLGEATGLAAAPTTSIAAAGTDEVSTAIAALFGNHAQEFQALTARAAAFHNEFVGLVKSGGGAYLSSEAANAEQMLGGAATAPAQALGGVTQKVGGAVTALENRGGASLLGGRMAIGAPAISQSITGLQTEVGALVNGFDTFGGTVAAPYQTLFSNTAANLKVLGSAISANPHPLLHQIISNQVGNAQTIGTGFVHTIENLPTELANLPGDIQSGLRALSSVNPAALAQHFINNQIGYAQKISTSVGAAAHDFTTGLHALPASFQTAFQDLAAGNTTGALGAIDSGLGNLFITGFNTTLGADGVLTVTPTGTLGDLLPILSIPGQMAQNFTNILPAGSIAAHMSQNFTNVVKTVTDLNVTSTINFVSVDGGAIDLNNTMGLPLVLVLDALGGPANALSALGHSATTFVQAIQSGNVLGATAAILDAPAAMANGFLNGQMTLPLSISALGLPTTIDIPLDGILVPAAQYTASVAGLGLPVLVTGTPVGGILSDILTEVPADLVAALGGPPAPVIPIPA